MIEIEPVLERFRELEDELADCRRRLELALVEAEAIRAQIDLRRARRHRDTPRPSGPSAVSASDPA